MKNKCKYCSALMRSDMGDEINYSDKEHTYVQICRSWPNEKQYYLTVGNMYHSVNTLSDIKYCPWCGRDLTKGKTMKKNKEREIELAEKFAKVKDEFAKETGALLWSLITKEVPDLTDEEINDIEAHHKDFRWILMSWDLQETAKEQGILTDEPETKDEI